MTTDNGRRSEHPFTEVSGRYYYVVVDSAPSLPVSDSVAVAGAFDGVLVVAKASRVTDSNVRDSLERLDRGSVPVLRMVLNKANNLSSGGSACSGYVSQIPIEPSAVSAAAPADA